MSLPTTLRAGSALLRSRPSLQAVSRSLSTTARSGNPGTEKRFVRIAGASSYATRSDLEFFLTSHGIAPPLAADASAPAQKLDLVQGQADVFQNQAIWIYDAGSADSAADVAGRLSGRVAGMKLVRAAPVDKRVVDDLMSVPEPGRGKPSLRRRMNAIKPLVEERGRALLVTNLPFSLPARFLWSFFASYEVVVIRHLRRSGVASVVFVNESEACRALRERSNLPIQGSKMQIGLKMHE